MARNFGYPSTWSSCSRLVWRSSIAFAKREISKIGSANRRALRCLIAASEILFSRQSIEMAIHVGFGREGRVLASKRSRRQTQTPVRTLHGTKGKSSKNRPVQAQANPCCTPTTASVFPNQLSTRAERRKMLHAIPSLRHLWQRPNSAASNNEDFPRVSSMNGPPPAGSLMQLEQTTG